MAIRSDGAYPDPHPTLQRKYDVIIAGGGVAGLVLANRLSEDASKSILVIEAGANRTDDDNIKVPGLVGSLWGNTDYDWNFWTEPQANVNNRVICQPRGKVLGGSSAINLALVLYPTRENFNAWTNLGNEGWSADEMAPYFRKFQTFYPADAKTREDLALDSYLSPELQGKDGPLAVTIRDTSMPFAGAWMKSFQNLGFSTTADPILGEKIGAFIPHTSINPKDNTRSYAASAYLQPQVSDRPNLHILTGSHVEKVVLDEQDDCVTAKGVSIEYDDGVSMDILADEVILAAGAMQSPQILELSGIGARVLLEKHAISTIVDLPGVGENFQDHPFAAVSFEIADGKFSGDITRDPEVVAALFKQYAETRQGPIGGGPMSSAYMPPVDTHGVMEAEKVQQLVDSNLTASSNGDDTFSALKKGQEAQWNQLRSQILNPKEATYQITLDPNQLHFNPGSTSMAQCIAKSDPRNMVSILVCLNHPISRGFVHIRSRDPKAPPLIDPRYLSHPLDIELLARGVQYLDRIVTTEPLRSLLKPASRLPNIPDFSNLDTAKEVVKERLFTNFHPTSTCAMMPRELGGVVDDKMRVYGVRGLRVVDASIFPMMTQGNIQATVYAVAERAADIIKAEWMTGS